MHELLDYSPHIMAGIYTYVHLFDVLKYDKSQTNAAISWKNILK